MANNKSVPTGAKVISVLYYISAGLYALFGVFLLLGAGVIGAILNQLIPLLGMLGMGFLAVIGIFLIGLGVLSFFIGRGLWKAQKWARILAIIFAILGILGNVLSLLSGITVSLIVMSAVNLFIAGYLLFSSSVREAFA